MLDKAGSIELHSGLKELIPDKVTLAELFSQMLQGGAVKRRFRDYQIGTQVYKQFPRDIQGDCLTPFIKGKVIDSFETQDSGWLVLELTDGRQQIVCIG